MHRKKNLRSVAIALLLSTLAGAAGAAIYSEDLENSLGQADYLDPESDCLSILRGSVSPADDQDYFYFSAAAGERIWTGTDTGGAAAGSTRDTAITLLGNDGVVVIEADDDDGTGTGGDATTESGDASAIAGAAAPSPGNYYVRVQSGGAGDVDPYRLLLAITSGADVSETEGNDSIGTANNSAGCNAAVTGAIATGSDLDHFLVTLSAGQLLFVSVDGDPARAGSSFNPLVTLKDSAGATVLTVDSSGDSSASPSAESFSYYAPSAGSYFVMIHSAGSTGSYRALITKSTEAALADLSVTLEASAGSVPPFGNYTYTVNVTNHSPAIAATGITFDLVLNGATVTGSAGTNWSCTTGSTPACAYTVSLAPGATSPDVTLSASAQDDDGAILATLTVSGDQEDDGPADNQVGALTDIETPASGGGGGGGGSWGGSLLLLALGALGRLTSRRPT